MTKTRWRRYRKLIAALVGAFGMAVTQGVLPEPVAKWGAVVVAFLTAAGVYLAPNAS